jgi:hypothetical protein
VCDIVVSYPGALLNFGSDDVSLGYQQHATDSGLSLGDWHLLECGALGIGSDAGQQISWFDGVELYRRTGANWTNYAVSEIIVGEPWSNDGLFVGLIDFDDVRTDVVPQAAWLVLDSGVGPFVAETCIPVSVGFRASDGTQAIAPYDMTVDISASDASTYVDPSCLTPGTTVVIDGGTVGTSFGLLVTTQTVASASASFIDFVSGPPVLLNVVAVGLDAGDAGSHDAGAPDAGARDGGVQDAGSQERGAADGGAGDAGSIAEMREYAVGCGCAGSPLSTLGAMLLTFFGLVRSRRERV